MIGFPTALRNHHNRSSRFLRNSNSPASGSGPENPGNPANADKIELGRLLIFSTQSCPPTATWPVPHATTLVWDGAMVAPLQLEWMGGPRSVAPSKGTSGTPLPERNTPGLVNVVFNGVLTGRIASPGAGADVLGFAGAKSGGPGTDPHRNRGEMRGESCPESEGVPGLSIESGRSLNTGSVSPASSEAPDTSVHATNLARALAVFERSLVAPNTPLDRFLAGDAEALSPQQRAGLREFQDSGCIACHGGPMLSDFQIARSGV